jgi:predicted component of type VI protein secretion system
MGIAFLEEGKLVHYGVKTIRDHNKSPHHKLRKTRKIILRLIRDFRPRVLMFEKA